MTHEEGKCCSSDGEESKCGCEGECDCQNSCSEDKCCSEQSMLATIAYMAKGAKMEILREKIKKKLESSYAKKLDDVADIAVEALVQCHEDKHEMKKKWQDLEKKLENVLEGK